MSQHEGTSPLHPGSGRGSKKRAPRPDLMTASEAINKLQLPKTTFQRLVRAKQIPKEIPYGKAEGFYPRAFIETLALHLQGKTSYKEVLTLLEKITHKEPEQVGDTDWVQPEDLPYVLALDYEVYGMDEVVDIAITSKWWKKNPYQCRILFDKADRTKIWGVLTLMPLPIELIHRLLHHDLLEHDITPEDILVYEPGHSFNVYVASAIIRPERRAHLRLLIQSMLDFWCHQYPSVQLDKLYASVTSSGGMHFIKHLYFAQIYELERQTFLQDAFVLDPYQKNPSRLIQSFQACLQRKTQTRFAVDEIAPDVPQVSSERVNATFARAQLQDIEGLTELAMRLFPRTIDAERRRAWFLKNPEGYYVVKKDKKVVAYFYLRPLKHDRLMAYLDGEVRGWDVTTDDIDAFEPGKPVECMLGGIGSDPDVGEALRSAYVAVLLRGIKYDLARLGRSGVVIPRVYAVANTPEGTTICLRLGMTPLSDKSRKRPTFELDIESTHSPFFQPYKRGLAAWREEQKQYQV